MKYLQKKQMKGLVISSVIIIALILINNALYNKAVNQCVKGGNSLTYCQEKLK
jgi:hypothetical protein